TAPATPRRPPAPTTPRSTAAVHATPGPHRSASAAGQPPTAWTSVVQQLDAVRADALVRRDTTSLSRVYTTGAAPMADDANTIDTLVTKGFRVAGAAHRIVATKLLTSAAAADKGGETIQLAVTDSLPSYRVLDATGAVVGSTAARASATRVLDLVQTSGGYRIAAVTTM
ncbi:MAG: hypothetical protein M3Y77_14645, partial [Actinomycetota bacterium]|nr:hypothetical protein [Actinomycetota bacterium]